MIHLMVILVWQFGRFFLQSPKLNRITINAILRWQCESILGQSTILNVHQFVFVIKSPNLYIYTPKMSDDEHSHEELK